MACYSPWVPAGSSSKRPVRCGKCIGCRLEYSRQWAVRIMHEAAMHEFNTFATFTYERNPVGLEYGDFQLMMRRMRKERGYVRFFCAGEYGEDKLRPHFHAVLFGQDFSDGEYLGKSPAGFKLWSSPALLELWKLGHVSVGSVTFESAAYVARYVCKKVDGVRYVTGWHPYVRCDADTGEEFEVRAEFARMSLRPGLGARWLDKYWSDVFPSGRVVVRDGKVAVAPRYYRKKFAERCPELAERLSFDFQEKMQADVEENAPRRLEAKEKVQRARLSMLKRKL